MIEAGSETSSQALNNAILGLLQNPGALVKAHEELDRVIGPNRTPTFDDEKDLPYIRAMIKVTPRWYNAYSRKRCDGDQLTSLII